MVNYMAVAINSGYSLRVFLCQEHYEFGVYVRALDFSKFPNVREINYMRSYRKLS